MFQHRGVILFIQLTAVYLQRISSTSSIHCSNLTFGHGEQQTSVSPFRIDVQNSTNGQLEVTLTANDNSTFQGFILQARKVGTNMALGTFVKLPNGTKAVQCTNGNNTATHSNNNTVQFSLTFTWSPPDNVTGKIVFNATVAANYSAYWLGISSEEISLPLMSTPRLTTSQSPPLVPSQSFSMQQPSLTPSPSQSPSVGEPPVSTQSPSIAPSQSFSMQQPSLTPSPSQSPSVGEPPVSTQSPSIAPSQSFSMQQPSLTPSPSQSPSVGEPPVSTQSPSTNQPLTQITTQSPTNSTQIPPTPRPTTFEVEMAIDQEFDDELNNNKSKRFQDLSTAVKTGVEDVYKKANRIVEVSVKSFRKGSIIAQMSLKFPTPVNASQALTTLRNAIKSKNFTIGNSTVLSIDVDECNSNPCHENAKCNNNVGSFTCTCNEGFTGDGKKCTVETTEDDDDDDIKKILIASVVLVAIILLIVLFFCVVLIRRLSRNK